jgi:glycosyltransferase involved in cell wall biosynthesis
MKVVILATAIGPTNRGIGQYERYVLPSLLKLLASAGCQGQVILAKDGSLPESSTGFEYLRLPSPKGLSPLRFVCEQICLPLWTRGADMFLSLESVFPLTPILAKRKIVVVHDMHVVRHANDPKRYPEDYSWQYRTWANRALRRAAEIADHIVTDSAFTAEEVHDLFRTPHERMTIIPLGLDHERFRPIKDDVTLGRVRLRYDLPETFHLYVGPYSRKKNLLLIVEAYLRAKNRGDIIHPVLVVGDTRRAPLYSATIARIEEAGLSNDFRFLGTVPDNDLAPLYSLARALIYPSLYEGFGLPPLEAMACGAPVIASKWTSLPEVVADAAVLIDPTDPSALLEALNQVKDELVRANLIARGLKRAQEFSWERTARKLAEVVLQQARRKPSAPLTASD